MRDETTLYVVKQKCPVWLTYSAHFNAQVVLKLTAEKVRGESWQMYY